MDALEEVLQEGIGHLVWSVDDQWDDAATLRSSVVDNGLPTIGELRNSVVLVLLMVVNHMNLILKVEPVSETD